MEDLVDDLDAPRRLHGTEVRGGHVWQCSLRNADDDRVLTDAEWAQIGQETIAAVGFADACRWIAVRHADNHIHLAVSLVREDGRVAGVWNDQRKLSAACAEFERRYGLVVRAQRDGAGMPGLARAEIERTVRAGHGEPARTAIARKIRAAAAAAHNEEEFVDRARCQGLLLRARWAAGGTRQVVGYSVAARTDGSEPLIWFGGGRLAADLTLPRLRRGWPQLDPARAAQTWRATPATQDRSAPPLRRQAWTEAGRVVEEIRRRLGAVPAGDAAGWSAAAGDAAALAAIAGRVEAARPGRLSRAADELARAAQLPYTARAAAPERLAGMAGVARAATDALIASRGGHAAVAILLAQLGRLVRQIQDAHAAGARAEQARRAQLAAEHMLAYVQAPSAAIDHGPQPAQATAHPGRQAGGRAVGHPRPEDGRDR